MPLYEYKCETCGEVFEVIQKFSDTPVAVHEKCGGKVNRLISRSSLHFKGSGFYVNDYAKAGNGSKKSASDTKTPSETTAKPDTKPSESKESKVSKESKESKTPSSTTPSKTE